MNDFTMTLTRESDALSMTISLSDPADAGRVIAAYRALLGLPDELSDQGVWEQIAIGTFNGLIENTTRHETNQQRQEITAPPIESAYPGGQTELDKLRAAEAAAEAAQATSEGLTK